VSLNFVHLWYQRVEALTSEEIFKILGSRVLYPENRVKKFGQVGYTVEKITVESGSATDIWNAEKRILKSYSKFKYLPLKIFGGQTECFTMDLPVQEIIDSLKN